MKRWSSPTFSTVLKMGAVVLFRVTYMYALHTARNAGKLGLAMCWDCLELKVTVLFQISLDWMHRYWHGVRICFGGLEPQVYCCQHENFPCAR